MHAWTSCRSRRQSTPKTVRSFVVSPRHSITPFAPLISSPLRRHLHHFGECLPPLDRVSNTGFLVNRQIVHDHDVAWVSRRNLLLEDLGQEQVAVPRAIHHPRSRESILPQRRHERCRLPVTVWHLADHALPASSTAVTTRPLWVGSGFVEEDQVSRVDSQPLGLPPNASRLHVGPILFSCVDHFF